MLLPLNVWKQQRSSAAITTKLSVCFLRQKHTCFHIFVCYLCASFIDETTAYVIFMKEFEAIIELLSEKFDWR